MRVFIVADVRRPQTFDLLCVRTGLQGLLGVHLSMTRRRASPCGVPAAATRDGPPRARAARPAATQVSQPRCAAGHLGEHDAALP